MGKKVDKLINRVAKNVKPRKGNTRKGSAIAILKSNGLIRQSKRGNNTLALTHKGRKAKI